MPRIPARLLAPLAAGLLAVSGCSGGDGTARKSDDPCRPEKPERVVPAPLAVQNLLEGSPRTTMDTDQDGKADMVALEKGALTVVRGDGLLRLTEPGHDVTIMAWADLDGDGRDDLIVSDAAPPEPTAVYLVSGATPAGTVAPSAAGVRVDDRLNYPWLQGLAGRPGADLVVPVREDGDSYTDVYDGGALLAEGPGADARGAEPVDRLDGLTRGIVALADGDPPETLLLVPGPNSSVRFAARPEARLESPLGPSHRVEDIVVFDESGGRKVGLQIDGQVAVWPVPLACQP